VTGFGLLGHLSEMVRQSGVTAEVMADRVPVLPEALEYVREQMISGAIERNIEYAQQFVTVADGVAADLAWVLYDPQTSGGLLMAIDEERAEDLVERLHAEGVEHSAIIGRVVEESSGRIIVAGEGGATVSAVAAPAEAGAEPEPCCANPPGTAAAEPCCAGAPDLSAGTADAREAFGAFMGAVNGEGAIDERTKELMVLALSVLAKCEPCVRIHVDKARAMGITDEEINEAVWLAISMGGAPIMMFYNALRGQA